VVAWPGVKWIMIIAGVWLIQYLLTLNQMRHYRSMIRQMKEKFHGRSGYYLFSGVARKYFGKGAVVLLVVNQEYRIVDCQVLHGATVFDRFVRKEEFVNREVGEVLSEMRELLHSRKRDKRRSLGLARAMYMAAENSLMAISRKRQLSMAGETNT